MALPPQLSSAVTTTDGTKVILTYNKALSANKAAASTFNVRSGGVTNAVTGVAVNGSTVELTLTNPIQRGQAVHASYVDPTAGNDANAVQDASGTDSATLKTANVNNQSTIIPGSALTFGLQQIGSDLDGRRKGARAGESVSLSENGQRIAIGSLNDRTIDGSRGSVRVYEQVGNGWQQLGSDINGEAKGDRFGSEVSLSSDGTRLAIGAVRNDVGGAKNDGGHARVYQFNETGWSQLGNDIDGESANDRSSAALKLSGNGTTVVIGALRNNNNRGHVKTYRYNELLKSWVNLGQELNGTQVKQYFGSAVDISEDGNVIAIGSYGFDPTVDGSVKPGRGKTEVYILNGNQWELRGNSILGEANNDTSGRSISLSADGNTIAIGAPGNDGVKNKNAGHVRVYNLQNNQWAQVGQDIDGDRKKDLSGHGVSLSSDGTRLAIAAPKYDHNGLANSGRGNIYELQGNTWIKLASINGEAAWDNSGLTEQGGTGISISGDGRRVTLGARTNDGGGKNAGHARVYDLNNNGPSLSPQTRALAENASAGEILDLNDQNTGTDKDPDGDAIRYSITSGNNSGIFNINTSSGAISIAAGKSLDYELATNHNLSITATDGEVSTTQTTTINVVNVNDNAPAISNANYTIAENAAAETVIHNHNDTHTGTDNDRDGNAINYTITGGNSAGLFAINAATGQIQIAPGKALDFETSTSHSLTTEASDGTNNDNATVVISVTNINDNSPSINNITVSVDEDKPAGTSVFNFNDSNTGNDTDADGDTIAYSITTGNNDGLFSIQGATGLVSIATGKSLDYSTATSHSLTIQASDSSNTDTAILKVNVGNTDTNAPSIDDANPTVAEDIAAGSFIFDVNDSKTGNDTDNDGQALSYVISGGNTGGLFAINAASGIISLASDKTLDFETATAHTVTIEASDGAKNDNAVITIGVSNVNDNAPSIANGSKTIAENAAAGTAIVNLNDAHTGTDNDRDGNAINYTISAGNSAGLFAINAATGQIQIAPGKALDFETATSHSLTARASDGSQDDTATVTISVANINDNTPIIANNNQTIAENAAAGTSIINLNDAHTGTDNDRDGNAINYTITGGNSAGLFAINAATGEIQIAPGKALDFETATSHSLTAQASDGAKADNANIIVNVQNINDNNPAFINRTTSVLETINSSVNIIDLADAFTANDADRDGDAIKYSFNTGNEEGLFAINETSGRINLATGKTLDFDRKDQHTLLVIGTDGTNQGSSQVTINVEDSNTAPVANDDSGSLNENLTLIKAAAAGVIQTNDTDAEGDNLEVISFQTGSLENPSPLVSPAGVTLDGEYGQLLLRQDGSYQYAANRPAADALSNGDTAKDTFSYTIKDGKLTDNAEIEFTINGINDAPVLVDAIKTKKYKEGQGNVTVIDGSLTIRDVDNSKIKSASVSITNAFQTTEDRLAFTNNFGITGAWNQGTGVLALTGSATKANYEQALQTITYENLDDANPVIGLRTVTWIINDGSLDSLGITSQIDVGGVNDSPEAFNEAIALDAGSSVSTPTNANLLSNDTDPEGDNLTIHSFRLGTEETSNPDFAVGNTITGLYGQLSVQANGNYSYIANQNAARRLLSGEIRNEAFNYTIRDTSNAEDIGEIVFTVTGVNDKPTATDDAKQIRENDNKFFTNAEGLLINDTDLDGDPLEVTNIRTGQKTASGIANKNVGNLIQGDYGYLTLESDGSYRFNANASDVDALDAGDIETDVFTYTLSDSQLEDTAEIRIDVQGINDAPILSGITAATIAGPTNSTALTSNHLTGQLQASDADASASLTYGISSVTTGGVVTANASSNTLTGTYGQLVINPSTGAYTYTPNTTAINSLAANQTTTESFEMFASDGSLSSRQTYSIQITGGNNSGSSQGLGSGGGGGGGGGGGSSGSNSPDTGSTGSGSTDSGSSDTGSSDSGTSGTGSSDSGSSDTGSSDSGSSDTGSSDSGSSGTGSSDSGSSDAGSSDSGSSGTGSSDATSSAPESTSTDLADSGFTETEFSGSDFANDAIAALLTDPITGSDDYSNFVNPDESLLVASTELDGIQQSPANDGDGGENQLANDSVDATNILVPMASGIDSDTIDQAIAELANSDTFRVIDSNHGVRLQLPNFSTEELLSQALNPTELESQPINLDTLETQKLEAEALNNEAPEPKGINSPSQDEPSWKQLVPANKTGLIPLLVTLNTQPDQAAVIQLKINHPTINGSTELEFTAENWNQAQLVWIDTSEFNSEEGFTTFDVMIGRQDGDNSDNIQIDTISLTIPNPKICITQECGVTSTQAEENSDTVPNLDLEFYNVIEERSAFFLLIKSTFAPFLVLTSVALDVFRQTLGDNTANLFRRPLEKDTAASDETYEMQVFDGQNFEIKHWISDNETAVTSSPDNAPFQITPNNGPFVVVESSTPFEIF